MKKPGVYIVKTTGTIWLVHDVEHYPECVIPDGSPEFSIVISGQAGDQKIHRCLIGKHQYKWFKYLGRFL